MGLIINGTINKIERTDGTKVKFINSLYINDKLYIITDDEDYYPELPEYEEIKSEYVYFELCAPNTNSNNPSNISINRTISADNKGSIAVPPGLLVAEYTVDYHAGNNAYTAYITFYPMEGCVIKYMGEEITSNDKISLTKMIGAGYPNPVIQILFQYKVRLNSNYTRKEVETIKRLDTAKILNNMSVGNNMEISGSINDIMLYYETYYVNTLTSDIGFGFYAQFYDSKYTINDIEYELPFFQLSPGLSYTTENITVSWLADGQLLLESKTSDPITNISFAPRILRYE